ncbi:Trihelix transcription factor PTL [Camellia lanceoleosa]|uniref:Trihelix transcription factor PTL n=1 Tax=Camellia lanceoleosa TaxID=1840588 RepID=A0ACC0GRR5_9ERIC|nr:Trihelix transcription factor PTL [Camellia lanceoleosa]
MEERNRNNYGFLDLRQIMDGIGRNCFPQLPRPMTTHYDSHNHSYWVVVVTVLESPSPPSFSATAHAHQFGLEMETVNGDGGGGSSSSSSRWPRQETLTLLEIRSRLDSKFKAINLKAPLWDDVSRIMWEEHGYQRSERKCRDKFENLYKYYKKTKECKAGRHDSKHYRFFRQLQALCEEPINESSDTHLAKYNLVYPNPMTNSFIFNQENQEDLQDQKLLESDNRYNSYEFEASSSINNGHS